MASLDLFSTQLSVDHRLDRSNIISPSISLRTGSIKYGWLRKWSGGSLKTSLHPGEKVSFDWRDESETGTWNTHADIPLDDAKKSKVSISRDWNF